jgi:hypothetical protein
MVAVMRVWSSIVFLGCACGTGKAPTPLYPDPGRQLAANEVATLYGDVREVDGKFVSEHGGAFALLPGCHVVGVVESWGRMDMATGSGVVVKIPRLAFVMPMRGGYRYVVRIDADTTTNRATVKAHEEDAEGNVTGQFGPVNAQAVADCQAGG